MTRNGPRPAQLCAFHCPAAYQMQSTRFFVEQMKVTFHGSICLTCCLSNEQKAKSIRLADFHREISHKAFSRIYTHTSTLLKVGYEYVGCSMVWHVQTTKVTGHDMVLSDVGGWNLQVQHKYNFHEGILQKGDGTNVYLKYKPLVVRNLMGDGSQRPLDCPDCNGRASEKSLLAPKSLVAAPDGSLFVADHNLIRRITPDGLVATLLQLK